MNKKTILLFAGVFGGIGAYIPILLGIDDGLGDWSVLGGLVGGLFGIWLATWVAKRL